MCGCSSASHVSCIPQQSRPGCWLLAGGRYLILMDVIWFIIRASLTLSPSLSLASHRSDVCRITRYLVHTLYTAAGGGEIFRTMLLFQADIWMTAGPGPCWNVVHCIVTEGAITRGWKLDILGTSWAPPPLHCCTAGAGAGGANSPTYRYLSVKDAKENTLAAGLAGAGCRSLQWIYRKR